MVALRPVAAFDIDGTIFRRQFSEMLVREYFERGIFPASQRPAYTELVLHQRDHVIDYPEYDRRLVTILLTGIVGADARDIEDISREVSAKFADYVYSFSRLFLSKLAPTHQRVAITGANDHLMQFIAPMWGFDVYYASVLEVVNGRYTGRELALPVLDKAATLRAHIDAGHATLEGSVGMGDTASDIGMLALVDHPVAFNPDFDLIMAAEKNHWPMVWEKKNAILVDRCGSSVKFHRSDVDKALAHVIAQRGCRCASAP